MVHLSNGNLLGGLGLDRLDTGDVLLLLIVLLLLSEGEELDFIQLPAMLARLGYARVQEVDTKGTYALRGDILDIYPINAENPVRIDFFGDTVEKIKPYDLATGERLGSLKSLRILSATDVGKTVKTLEAGEIIA